LTRALARLRRETPELRDGEQRLLDAAPGVLAFTRGESILVAVNFRGDPAPLPAGGVRLLSSEAGRRGGGLAPYEAAVLRLNASATRSSS
jgi:alpha-glucosidase